MGWAGIPICFGIICALVLFLIIQGLPWSEEDTLWDGTPNPQVQEQI